MRSAFSSSSHAPTPPLRGTARAGKGESARLLPKDRYNCQRSGPSNGTKPMKRRPRVAAGQRTGARRHKDQSLQPHGSSPPDTAAGSPKGATDRLGRSNRSAAGYPTWRPMAPVSRPFWSFPRELPRKEPPRGGYRRWRFSSRLQGPEIRAFSEERRHSGNRCDGAFRARFQDRVIRAAPEGTIPQDRPSGLPAGPPQGLH
jgi:hypothetical protein